MNLPTTLPAHVSVLPDASAFRGWTTHDIGYVAAVCNPDGSNLEVRLKRENSDGSRLPNDITKVFARDMFVEGDREKLILGVCLVDGHYGGRLGVLYSQPPLTQNGNSGGTSIPTWIRGSDIADPELAGLVLSDNASTIAIYAAIRMLRGGHQLELDWPIGPSFAF